MMARLSTLTAVGGGACADGLAERPRTPARIAFRALAEARLTDLSNPDGAGALYLVGEQNGAPLLLQLDRSDRLRTLRTPEEAEGRLVAVAAQGRRLAVAYDSGQMWWVDEGLCCRFEPAPVDLAPNLDGGFWVLTPEGLFEDRRPGTFVAEGGHALVPGAGGGVAVLRDQAVGAWALAGLAPEATLAATLRAGALMPSGRLYGLDGTPNLRVVDGLRVGAIPSTTVPDTVTVDPEGEVWVATPRGVGRVRAGGLQTFLTIEEAPLLERRFLRMAADDRSLTLTSSASVFRLVFAAD
ncbi:MAG: hypothetical protein AAF627_01025 [Myxococcota bacterium]